MVLHVFTSFLGGVLLCIPYGLYSGTSLGGTTWRTLEGYPSRVLSYPLANQALPTCNTPWCIAKQFPNQPTSLLQYNFLPLHTHVAIQSSIAIHFPLANTALQNYHHSAHVQMGSSPFSSCTILFFFSFSRTFK